VELQTQASIQASIQETFGDQDCETS